MKSNKDYSFGIGFCKISADAYKNSKTWCLGFHLILDKRYKIFRICFFRTKNHTYYWEVYKSH